LVFIIVSPFAPLDDEHLRIVISHNPGFSTVQENRDILAR
jgi:hypothetical protein